MTVPKSEKNPEIAPIENFSAGIHLTKIEKALADSAATVF